jgi:hypothetical protein
MDVSDSASAYHHAVTLRVASCVAEASFHPWQNSVRQSLVTQNEVRARLGAMHTLNRLSLEGPATHRSSLLIACRRYETNVILPDLHGDDTPDKEDIFLRVNNFKSHVLYFLREKPKKSSGFLLVLQDMCKRSGCSYPRGTRRVIVMTSRAAALCPSPGPPKSSS